MTTPPAGSASRTHSQNGHCGVVFGGAKTRAPWYHAKELRSGIEHIAIPKFDKHSQ
jgi:hypothetical protein